MARDRWRARLEDGLKLDLTNSSAMAQRGPTRSAAPRSVRSGD